MAKKQPDLPDLSPAQDDDDDAAAQTPGENNHRMDHRQPTPETKAASAQQILAAFAFRAYRRPVAPAEGHRPASRPRTPRAPPRRASRGGRNGPATAIRRTRAGCAALPRTAPGRPARA